MNSRRVILILILSCLMLSTLGSVSWATAESMSSNQGTQKILKVRITSEITKATAIGFSEAMSYAESGEFDLIVLELNTPGGLVSATEEIVAKLVTSEIPVMGWVPEGGAAFSGGTFLLMACRIAAMGSSTRIGSAHPVDSTGAPVTYSKYVNPLTTLMKANAKLHTRNETAAEDFVLRNLNLDENSALASNVVEIAATDLDDALQQLESKKLLKYNDATDRYITLDLNADTSGYNTVAVWNFGGVTTAPISVYRDSIAVIFLSIVSNPLVLGVLFLLGTTGLVFGLLTPGVGAEIIGAISLILALVGSSVIEVNIAAILLLVLGGFLMYFEVKKGILALGAGGIACFVFAGIIMFPSSAWIIQSNLLQTVQLALVAFGAVAGVLLLFGSSLAMKARKKDPATGRSSFVGKTAKVIHGPLYPGVVGKVRFRDAIWKAEAISGAFSKGDKVKIVEVDGLILKVSPHLPTGSKSQEYL